LSAPARSEPVRALTHRLPAVDFLRGLCILAVVLHHINLRIRFNKSELGKHLPDLGHRALFWSGSYGVKVFFVISGFLITTTILARWGSLPEIDVKRFYRLRFARIAPCLLALLAVLSVLHLAGVTGFVINPKRAKLPRALLAALTFHVNWLETKVSYLPANWDVLWSLSVEETFYLAYPLVCRFIRNRWVMAAMALALMAAGPFARTAWAPNDIGSDYLYFANLDGIALGCVTAVLAWKRPAGARAVTAMRYAGWALMALVAIGRPAAAALGLYKPGLDVTALEFGAALLLFAIAHKPSTGTAAGGVVRWYGRNSYEVYLTHSFFTVLGLQLFQKLHSPIDTAIWWFLGLTALSGVVGAAVARYYSEPLNRRLRAAQVATPTVANIGT
jgi:peptidoglycan/LPS O-acetylase OafA/YrhL